MEEERNTQQTDTPTPTAQDYQSRVQKSNVIVRTRLLTSDFPWEKLLTKIHGIWYASVSTMQCKFSDYSYTDGSLLPLNWPILEKEVQCLSRAQWLNSLCQTQFKHPLKNIMRGITIKLILKELKCHMGPCHTGLLATLNCVVKFGFKDCLILLPFQ